MRTTGAAPDAARATRHNGEVNLVELVLDAPTGAVRWNTSRWDIVWNGSTWFGAGSLIGISPTEETTEAIPGGLTLTISSVPDALLTMALDAAYDYPGRAISMWSAALDGGTYAVLATPTLEFSGEIDTMTITEGRGGSSVVTIQCENDMIRLTQADEELFTDAGQKSLYPADRGLEFLSSMSERVTVFGMSGG